MIANLVKEDGTAYENLDLGCGSLHLNVRYFVAKATKVRLEK